MSRLSKEIVKNSLKKTKFFIKRSISRGKQTIKRNAPGLLMTGGIVSMVGGTVSACKATLKVHDIIDDAVNTLHFIESLEGQNKPLKTGEIYTTELAAIDKKNLKIKTMVAVAKGYLPAITLIALGIVGVCCGHAVLKQRYTTMIVAYEGLKTSFENYRKKVADKWGKEAENDIYYGEKTKKIVKAIDENGEVYDKEIETRVGGCADGYHVIFCPETTRDFSDWNTMNAAFIIGQLSYLNRKLKEDGYVYLNTALEAFGFEPVPEGQVLGWIDSPDKKMHGEDEFKIWLGPDVEDFVRNCEIGLLDDVVESIWHEFIFNVDGNIVNSLLDKKKEKVELNYLDQNYV